MPAPDARQQGCACLRLVSGNGHAFRGHVACLVGCRWLAANSALQCRLRVASGGQPGSQPAGLCAPRKLFWPHPTALPGSIGVCRFYTKVLGFRAIPRPDIGFPGGRRGAAGGQGGKRC